MPNKWLYFLSRSLEASQRINIYKNSDIKKLIEQAEEAENLQLWGKAIEIRKKIIQILKQSYGKFNDETINALNDLGFLYNELGRYKKAEHSLKEAIEYTKKLYGSEHEETLILRSNLAFLYINRDKYKQAEPLYKENLEISKKLYGLNHSYTVVALNDIGSFYHYLGDFQKAEFFLKKSLEISRKINGLDHKDTISTMQNLGSLFDDLGQYQRAKPLLEEALNLNEKINGFYSLNTGINYKNLSLLYVNLGQFEEAEFHINETFKIYKKLYGLEHLKTARVLNDIAYVYMNNNKNEIALEKIKESIRITKKLLGMRHSNVATSLSNLALIYRNLNQYQEIEPLLKKVLEIDKKIYGITNSNTSTSLHNLGSYYSDLGQYKKAESLQKKALEINKRIFKSDHPKISNSLIGLGWTYKNLGNQKKFISLSKAGTRMELLLIQREVPFLPISDRRAFLKPFSHNNKLYFSLNFEKEENRQLAFFSRLNRQGLLEEIERNQFNLISLKGQKQNLFLNLKNINQELSNKDLTNKQKQVLLSKKKDLETKLYRILPNLKPRIVEISEIVDVLPKDSILIEYQIYQPFINREWQPERYLAMILNPKKIKGSISSGKTNFEISIFDLGPALTIEKKIKEALISTQQESEKEAAKRWRELSRLIIEPLAISVNSKKTWFISPDGELNLIPFAALSLPDKNGILIEEKELRLLTTGREQLDLKRNNKLKSNLPLIVSNPSFNKKTILNNFQENKTSFVKSFSQKRTIKLKNFKWQSLPWTQKEGEKIAKEINGKLITEENATANAIINYKNPKVLHIATHSFYFENRSKKNNQKFSTITSSFNKNLLRFIDDENPLLRSGIVLAGANYPEFNFDDDGYLTALEISKLDWNSTEMVVVSGCQSGQGEVKNGESIYGLKRAIAVAGAKSSLLSLWEVDDEATYFFMKSFYEYLKKGIGRSEALSKTQKEFRESKNKLWRHPYVWAAFQLSGDWRPIYF